MTEAWMFNFNGICLRLGKVKVKKSSAKQTTLEQRSPYASFNIMVATTDVYAERTEAVAFAELAVEREITHLEERIASLRSQIKKVKEVTGDYDAP